MLSSSIAASSDLQKFSWRSCGSLTSLSIEIYWFSRTMSYLDKNEEDPGLAKAREEAKEKFSFSDPEQFFLKIDRTDPVAFVRARDAWFQSRIVEVEMIKIYRKRLEACYGKDPVNHKQNCRKHVLDYLGAWQYYRDNKAFLRTPGGNIQRFKPTLEELYP